MELVEIVVTGPADFVQKLVTQLVADRLIACAQCATVRSTYRWAGSIERDEEVRAQLHTTAARAGEVGARIDDAHPYDVPCILVLPVLQALPAYAAWVAAQTAPQP